MGQYYLIANLDKEEYLHPHTFNDGLKFLEFSLSSSGTLTALSLLLVAGYGQGIGEHAEHIVVGRWAGDRIAVVGDYYDPALTDKMPTFEYIRECYADISFKVLEAFMTDPVLSENRDFQYVMQSVLHSSKK